MYRYYSVVRITLKILALVAVLFSLSTNAKERAQTIAQLWYESPSLLFFGGCTNYRLQAELTLLNEELSYLSFKQFENAYFFYAGDYTLNFRCKISEFHGDNETVVFDDEVTVKAHLAGGEKYGVSFGQPAEFTDCRLSVVKQF